MKHLQSKQCCYLSIISMERLKRLQEFGKEILPFGLEWLPILLHHAIPGIRRSSLFLQDQSLQYAVNGKFGSLLKAVMAQGW